MLKRFILALSIASVVVVPAVAHADRAMVGGVLTKVEEGLIEIRTDNRETISVSLNTNTHYLKWITAKPWQQDPHTNRRALRVGQRVRVDVNVDQERGNSRVARTVWIVVGLPGLD